MRKRFVERKRLAERGPSAPNRAVFKFQRPVQFNVRRTLRQSDRDAERAIAPHHGDRIDQSLVEGALSRPQRLGWIDPVRKTQLHSRR